eukprot:3470415-Pleurochrysis_carterae.AAC.1
MKNVSLLLARRFTLVPEHARTRASLSSVGAEPVKCECQHVSYSSRTAQNGHSGAPAHVRLVQNSRTLDNGDIAREA